MDGELLLPRLGAHQEEVGDVRARDEQDDADRAEEHPQHAPDVADDVDRRAAGRWVPSSRPRTSSA